MGPYMDEAHELFIIYNVSLLYFLKLRWLKISQLIPFKRKAFTLNSSDFKKLVNLAVERHELVLE